jgi:hypothetical protein
LFGYPSHELEDLIMGTNPPVTANKCIKSVGYIGLLCLLSAFLVGLLLHPPDSFLAVYLISASIDETASPLLSHLFALTPAVECRLHHRLDLFLPDWSSLQPAKCSTTRTANIHRHCTLPTPTPTNWDSIGRNNVVILCLYPSSTTDHPEGDRYGTAETAYKQMKATFASLNVGLFVAVGSGIPCGLNDIRLGDVLVGTPEREFWDVVGFALGSASEPASSALDQRRMNLLSPREG